MTVLYQANFPNNYIKLPKHRYLKCYHSFYWHEEYQYGKPPVDVIMLDQVDLPQCEQGMHHEGDSDDDCPDESAGHSPHKHFFLLTASLHTGCDWMNRLSFQWVGSLFYVCVINMTFI